MPKKYKMPNEGKSRGSGKKMSKSSMGGSGYNSGAGNNRPQTYMQGLGSGDSRRMRMGTNMGASGGLKKSNEMRSDMTQSISHHNPYPHGLA